MNWTNKLNLFLSNPTWDILLLLFFFAAVFIYGVVVGRNRINEYVPYPKNFLNNLNIAQIIFLKSFIFFILIVFIFWIFKKSGFSRKELNKKTGQVLFLSFINVGLWANIIFGYVSVLNSQAIKLAPLTKLLFGSDWAHLIWFILPILVLYWFERK